MDLGQPRVSAEISLFQMALVAIEKDADEQPRAADVYLGGGLVLASEQEALALPVLAIEAEGRRLGCSCGFLL